MKELRCYHFGNFYLSSIQQGIQSAHGQMELFTKYNIAKAMTIPNIDGYTPTQEQQRMIDATAVLYDWANHHKTMICLNGGDDEGLENILSVIDHVDNPFPFSTFNESKSAMAGMRTNIAIVLPDYIFNTAQWLRNKRNKMYQPDHSASFMLPPDAVGIDMLAYSSIEYTNWEFEFMNTLNKCGLAR